MKRKCAYGKCAAVNNDVRRNLAGVGSITNGNTRGVESFPDRGICRRWPTGWQEKTSRFSITSEIMTFNALTHNQSKAELGGKSEEHYKPEDFLNTNHPWQLHCEVGDA